MSKAAVLIQNVAGSPNSADAIVISYNVTGGGATLSGQVEVNLLDASATQQTAVRAAALSDLQAFGAQNNGFSTFTIDDIAILFTIV